MDRCWFIQKVKKILGLDGWKTWKIGAFLGNFGGDIEFQLIIATLKEIDLSKIYQGIIG